MREAVERVIASYVEKGLATFDDIEAITYAGREMLKSDPKLEFTVDWLAKGEL